MLDRMSHGVTCEMTTDDDGLWWCDWNQEGAFRVQSIIANRWA